MYDDDDEGVTAAYPGGDPYGEEEAKEAAVAPVKAKLKKVKVNKTAKSLVPASMRVKRRRGATKKKKKKTALASTAAPAEKEISGPASSSSTTSSLAPPGFLDLAGEAKAKAGNEKPAGADDLDAFFEGL